MRRDEQFQVEEAMRRSRQVRTPPTVKYCTVHLRLLYSTVSLTSTVRVILLYSTVLAYTVHLLLLYSTVCPDLYRDPFALQHCTTVLLYNTVQQYSTVLSL